MKRINSQNAIDFVTLDYIQNNTNEKVGPQDQWTKNVQNWIKTRGYLISLTECSKLINEFVDN
jgi:hypothetical protein